MAHDDRSADKFCNFSSDHHVGMITIHNVVNLATLFFTKLLKMQPPTAVNFFQNSF